MKKTSLKEYHAYRHNEFHENNKRIKRSPIVINGKLYSSASEASLKTGISSSVIFKIRKELINSKRSEIQREVTIRTEMTFNLHGVKDERDKEIQAR